MRKSRYTEEQIIGFIKQADAGMNVADLCRKEGFSTATFYKWRSKFGGMEVPDARRLRELEAENAKLKKLLAEAHLDMHALKSVLGSLLSSAGGERILQTLGNYVSQALSHQITSQIGTTSRPLFI